MGRVINKSQGLKDEIKVKTDKSISHRAVIFAAVAQGESIIRNFLQADDTMATCNCIENLGIDIRKDNGSTLIVEGKGFNGFQQPGVILFCDNSGTTMRLMSGVLAGQPFFSMLSGDDSLNNRPMKRIIEPLTMMGAQISARNHGNYAPLAINGSKLKGIKYKLSVPSAQVKSSILLAGLYAHGETTVMEPVKSRDHTERMLASMGADLRIDDLAVSIKPSAELKPQEFKVPGDISSAAFFMVAATIVEGSELKINDVGINPTRSGIIDILKSMGADIKIENQRIVGGEPIADLIISSASLKGTNVGGDAIPRLIDEIPVLSVAMAVAEGQSVVTGAQELRVKETDRIAAICSELSKMGADIQETEDGLIINGRPGCLTGAKVGSHGDHRIAMSLAVAALAARGETIIEGSKAVAISFPGFWELLDSICS